MLKSQPCPPKTAKQFWWTEKLNVVLVLALSVLLVPISALGRNLELDIPGLIEAANQDRVAAGLPALKESPALNRAAALKAADMVRNGYFSHTSPNGIDPWHWFQQAGYEYSYAGENLALDFDNVETLEAAWMASPKHRANILNSEYREIGFAIAEGTFTNINGVQKERTGTIIVQLFGKPLRETQIAAAPGALKLALPKISGAPAAFASSSPASKPEPVNVWPLLSLAIVILLVHEQSKVELI